MPCPVPDLGSIRLISPSGSVTAAHPAYSRTKNYGVSLRA